MDEEPAAPLQTRQDAKAADPALAAALRANLSKRKAQLRGRDRAGASGSEQRQGERTECNERSPTDNNSLPEIK